MNGTEVKPTATVPFKPNKEAEMPARTGAVAEPQTAENGAPELSEAELEAFRKVQRAKRLARQANMSEEELAAQKAKRQEYNRERLQRIKSDPEANAARLARQKAYQQKRREEFALNPELAAEHKARQKAYRESRRPENMTPEERLQVIRKEQERLAQLEQETLAEVGAH